MKNLIKIIFIIVIVFITMSVFKLFKNEHKVTYKIDNYSIKEHFYKKNNHYYDITINDKNNTYIYTLNKNLGKKKKIIKDIKTYKSKNLVCIVPIYKKDITNNIYCSLNKKQVSASYLQSISNLDFNKIVKKAKKYKLNLVKNNDNKTVYKQLEVYKKNITDDHIYFIWNYKGIYIVSNNEIKYKKIVNHDLYDNVMDCVVDDYYVIFDNSSVNGIENVYYYDINKDKVNRFKLKTKLTKNTYINGVIDNLIYVTDRKQKKEYTINIKNKSIVEVDNDQTNYIVYDNGTKKELTKSDYFMQDKFFNNNLISDSKVTSSKELKKEYNYYYFIEENRVYKALDTNKKDKILLVELDNITDWLIRDREIILLRDGTLYSYTDDFGLRKILTTNELRYNYKNIYDFWKK